MKIRRTHLFLACLALNAMNISEVYAVPTASSTQTNEELKKEIARLTQQMQAMQTSLNKLENQYKAVSQKETVLEKYTVKHEKMNRLLVEKGHHTAGPELVFSGNLSMDATASDRTAPSSYTGTGSNNMKISNAQLNAQASVTPWARGYISLNDDFGTTNTTGTSGDALEFEQAYMQLGLRQSPVLLNIGKQYLPFGVYKQHPITSPLTQELSEFVKTAAVVGYRDKWLFASGYIFSGQASTSGATHTTSEQLNKNYGFEVGTSKHYETKSGIGYEASIGYINNLVEAKNIYAVVPKTQHAVGNLAPHFDLSFGKLNFVLDYTHATRTFASSDISMNGKAARPRAFSSEIHYHFLTNKHPSTFAVGYQRSWDALFMNLAKHRYTASYQYHFNQYVSMQFELMHNIDYGANDYATYLASNGATATVNGTGDSSNAGIMRLSLHF